MSESQPDGWMPIILDYYVFNPLGAQASSKTGSHVTTRINNIPNGHVLSGDVVSLKLNTWSIKLQMLWINCGGEGAGEPWWKLINKSQFHTLAVSLLQRTQISSRLPLWATTLLAALTILSPPRLLVVKLLILSDCWMGATERKKRVSQNNHGLLFGSVLMSNSEQVALTSGQIGGIFSLIYQTLNGSNHIDWKWTNE